MRLLLLFFFLSFTLFGEVSTRHVTKEGPLSIHIVEIDPHTVDIFPVRALDLGVGKESVASLAKRYGALTAINGGFFSIDDTPYDGTPRGILKIDHKWFGLARKRRGAIGWSDPAKPLFDRLWTEGYATIGNTSFALDGLNQERKENQIILYTSDFGKTTLTSQDGLELVCKKGKVIEIRECGSSAIPEGAFVLSIGKERLTSFPKEIHLTQPVRFHINLFSNDAAKGWLECPHIVGGAPLLIHGGKRITDFSEEKTLDSFLNEKHARSAVGVLGNGNWVFVSVDGKQPDLSIGMTIEELSLFMESLGCREALNLDGGGSTTLFYDGDIINSPAGDEDEKLKGKMRKVSDAILVLPLPHPKEDG